MSHNVLKHLQGFVHKRKRYIVKKFGKESQIYRKLWVRPLCGRYVTVSRSWTAYLRSEYYKLHFWQLA